MIDLAPHHKIGLPLSGPVLLASGCWGYGYTYDRLLDLTPFGAVVTNPITLRPRRGASQPRLIETTAGFILNTGLQNPGVKKVIQQYSKSWPRLGVPIIAHLPGDEPDDLRRTARALASTETIVAIELGVPREALPADLEQWVRAIREGCMLPLLVKLPLETVAEMAMIAAEMFIDALVIGGPPRGTAQSSVSGEMVGGDLYGPALHSLVLTALQSIQGFVECPIVAAGGIHSVADAKAYLQAGATAIQLDTLLFIEPKLAFEIAIALRSDRAETS